jgi:hypothetical protein
LDVGCNTCGDVSVRRVWSSGNGLDEPTFWNRVQISSVDVMQGPSYVFEKASSELYYGGMGVIDFQANECIESRVYAQAGNAFMCEPTVCFIQ